MSKLTTCRSRSIIWETIAYSRLYFIHQGGLFQWVVRHGNTINSRRLSYRHRQSIKGWNIRNSYDTQPTWIYWISIIRTYNPYVQKSKSQSYLMQLVPTLARKTGKAKISISRDNHTIPTKINGCSTASIEYKNNTKITPSAREQDRKIAPHLPQSRHDSPTIAWMGFIES